MKFDSMKSSSPDRVRDQMSEFVLRYLMRISSFLFHDAYTTERVCLPTGPERIGFGYTQHLYKLLGAEQAAAFPPEMANQIIDLRELFWKYEWILVKVDLYSFYLRFRPFGPGAPSLEAPLRESTYLVLTRDFMLDDSSKQDRVIGRYGFGYAMVKNPEPRLLAYGPRVRSGV